MRKKISWPLALLSLTLAACQSTAPPDWYTEIPTNDSQYFTAVGKGRSLQQAKKEALSQINSQLWTQIDSTYASRDVFQTQNDASSSHSYIDNKINSKTTSVTFNDIEYTKVEQNDLGYFVEARVERPTVIQQLKSDIKNSDHKAELQLAELKHQDSLTWWLNNRESAQQADFVAIRQAMLKSLKQDDIPLAPSVTQLVKSITEVKSNLLVRFISQSSNRKAAELLQNQFGDQGIQTTTKATSRVTHTLRLSSELRQNKVGQTFVATDLMTLNLQGRKGNTLASSEIISSGNSLTNYAFAKEGAQRHFAEIVANQGLWESLGIQ